jgi:GDP-D-mannose dehydratase
VLEALKYAGLDLDIKRYVDYDGKMVWPAEVDLLVSEATNARKKLLWPPSCNFSNLVKKMIEQDLILESSN